MIDYEAMTDELLKLSMRDDTKDRLKASVRPIAGAALGTGTAYAVHDLARRGVERHLAKSLGVEQAKKVMQRYAQKSAPVALATGALLVPALDLAVRHSIDKEKQKGLKKEAIGALVGAGIGAVGGGVMGARAAKPGSELKGALIGAGIGGGLGALGGAKFSGAIKRRAQNVSDLGKIRNPNMIGPVQKGSTIAPEFAEDVGRNIAAANRDMAAGVGIGAAGVGLGTAASAVGTRIGGQPQQPQQPRPVGVRR